MRYRTRRHKLGSQGTGDAAGFTISPPAIALFFSLSFSLKLTTPPLIPSISPSRSAIVPPFLFCKRILCKFTAALDSASRIIIPKISRRNRGDKVEAGKLFRRVSTSRAFAEICGLARAELQDPPSWIYKIRAWRTRNGSTNEEIETHFLRSLRNYNAPKREYTNGRISRDERASLVRRRNRSRFVSFAR